METFYFILLVVTLLVLYGIGSLSGRIVVQGVEAGPIGECDPRTVRAKSFRTRPVTVYDNNGNPVDTKEMIQVIVCGDCMVPRKILNNTQLLVQRIDKNKVLEDQLKQGDIIMIHLADENIDKIRVFDKFDENKQLLTYRYSSSNERVNSSFPHSRESVVGVVRYKI